MTFPLTVGEGQVFLLGDNREQASDSRILGCVDIAKTEGKVVAILRTRAV
ncbi:S26 family signal peptidase [Collinsella sp. AGMB00827]|uniref:S26 family signal peptidase n=1 Tax=Collinsella ureilytica TaxID=2869515 RepID=A0ABS7MIA7_9ACTN|nr:S26 family signal peptidase [Collinsella urealyticum]